jgi:2-polyprenyl-3-methyl-5-hydroxy-6-metoxy-1,4-benzoquinol methylase
MGYLKRPFEQTGLANKAEILDIIEPRPGSRLLDSGCGNGESTARLARRDRVSEAYGIEGVDQRIEEASGRGTMITKADLNGPLPYQDGFFDIVHANQVIEHLTNFDLFLRQIWRVLRPDGYAMLTASNLASWHNVFSPACRAAGRAEPLALEARPWYGMLNTGEKRRERPVVGQSTG